MVDLVNVWIGLNIGHHKMTNQCNTVHFDEHDGNILGIVNLLVFLRFV